MSAGACLDKRRNMEYNKFMERYCALNRHLQERFGKKLYKLALSTGFSCPNRDGTVGTEGCLFCADGSGVFSQSACFSVTEQIRRGAALVENKLKHRKERGYIAYFQSFTNTYGPLSVMERLFSEAVAHPQVEVLSVATRPDCLPDETVALLARLRRSKPVWVELGLQTANDATARYLRRGYDTRVYEDACRRLRREGLEVITHLILGLPGEGEEDLLHSVRLAGRYSHGVKLQLLHVLKGTALADTDYVPLEREEYFRLLALALEHLPPDCVIHRLTGDGARGELLAPRWSLDKKGTLGGMQAYFDFHDVRQGRYYEHR